MRGLLKKGNTDALRLFGWHGSEGIETTNLKLSSMKVQPGGKLEFAFSIKPVKPVNENVRLEYTIDFITSSGKTSRKIFKITEGKFEKGKIYNFAKKHSFKDLTIRKHFKGKHTIAIVVNGDVSVKKDFYLV